MSQPEIDGVRDGNFYYLLPDEERTQKVDLIFPKLPPAV